MVRVGFIGLGRMGKPMALNLARAGFSVVVHDRRRGPMEEVTPTPASAAWSPAEVAACEVVCTSLPDEAASEGVYLGADGLVPNGHEGHFLVETSTIGPRLARRIAQAAAERGIGYLDAPISGGEGRAADGTLTIMVGGEAAHFEQAVPVLRAMGKNIHHVGPVGQGMTVKLVNQLLVSVHTLASCEAVFLGTRAGVDPMLLLDILGTSWGASTVLARVGPAIVERDFSPQGVPVRILLKDMGLVLELAEELGVDLPLGERTLAFFQAAADHGLAEMEVTALVTVLEDHARRSGALGSDY